MDNQALRHSILNEVNIERYKQVAKWGNESDDLNNTPFHWVTWIVKNAVKFTDGTWSPDINAFRASMIQVAALAVAAIESVDRKAGK